METQLRELLAKQREAQLRDGPPSAALRRDRIDRMLDMLLSNSDAFVAAMSADFGHRSPLQSTFTDVVGVMQAAKSDRANLEKWMKPRRAGGRLGSLISGAARIEYVPRGVVGIIAPWNFPLSLALSPLSQAFAAGNRAMLKMSELTPRTAELLRETVTKAFDPTECTVITGGPEVGAMFSALPFDLMFFTGGTAIARHVQHACAENLVPSVLELGGKSPVVISPDADFKQAALRIAVGKTANAGQICLAPDYVFAPEGKERAFADALTASLTRMYPTLRDNDDYTSIVADRHYDRLRAHLADAEAKGGKLLQVNPAGEDFTSPTSRKIPPTIVLNANPQMTLLQDEIFGPVLPVMGYRNIDQVIDYVNERPRPLAVYYFGPEDAACRRFIERTTSGGVCINDVLSHAGGDQLPFGGIGDS
ncbi:MAG TPA: coniferyl aldehyde dehydrogenase, partial [Alphaproteobacteria bacterium]|nr:coniferyl aldehyde dehydrogenase [Alphaproteobacteria bacterium]